MALILLLSFRLLLTGDRHHRHILTCMFKCCCHGDITSLVSWAKEIFPTTPNHSTLWESHFLSCRHNMTLQNKVHLEPHSYMLGDNWVEAVIQSREYSTTDLEACWHQSDCIWGRVPTIRQLPLASPALGPYCFPCRQKIRHSLILWYSCQQLKQSCGPTLSCKGRTTCRPSHLPYPCRPARTLPPSSSDTAWYSRVGWGWWHTRVHRTAHNHNQTLWMGETNRAYTNPWRVT